LASPNKICVATHKNSKRLLKISNHLVKNGKRCSKKHKLLNKKHSFSVKKTISWIKNARHLQILLVAPHKILFATNKKHLLLFRKQQKLSNFTLNYTK
jgi:hypothetical protein